jgi:FkbM family methyltransferase
MYQVVRERLRRLGPLRNFVLAARRRRSALAWWLRGVGRQKVRTTTYLGHDFEYPFDSIIGRHIARGGDWDHALRVAADVFLPREGARVCDVGSNIGASLLQIYAVRPGASVTAFEPSSRFAPLLERNLHHAGIENGVVRRTFIGGEPGRVWLYNNESSASALESYADHIGRGRELVEVRTLDQLLGGYEIHLIKTDTDGFDVDVFRGATNLLQEWAPVLFFELAPALMKDPIGDLVWLGEHGYGDFVCLASGQNERVLGRTRNPHEAVRWATDASYCDVLVCRERSRAYRLLTTFLSIMGR